MKQPACGPVSRGVKAALGVSLLSAVILPAFAENSEAGRLTAVRFWSLGDVTRVAVETNSEIRYRTDRVPNPDRIFFDLHGVKPKTPRRGVQIIPVGDKLLKQIRIAETQPGVTRVVLDVADGAVEFSASQLTVPDRLIIELRTSGKGPGVPPLRSVTGNQPIPAESGMGEAAARPEARTATPAGKHSEQQVAVNRPPESAKTRADQPSEAGPREAAKPAVSRPPAQLVTHRPPEPVKSQAAEPTEPGPGEAAKPGTRAPSAQVVADRPPEPVKPQAGEPSEPGPSDAAKPTPGGPSAQLVADRPAESVKTRAADPLEPVVERAVTGSRRAGRSRAGSAKQKTALKTEVAKPQREADPGAASAAEQDSRGSRSLIRALGLKIGRVVLDPGHGGHDTGTIGPDGLTEKELVLDVTKRLGKLISERLGSEVVYTRSTDTFVPLEARTVFANEKRADLFLSIHANSSRVKNISGPETFYLNFSTSSADMEVAAKENATSQRTVYELQDLLQKIARKDKVQESREFASFVQTAMYGGLRGRSGGKDRGVKKAPFIVLMGAQMPSVLAEIAFLSNPKEEKLLRRPDYRQRIAEALYKGVAMYANTLSHFQVARGSEL